MRKFFVNNCIAQKFLFIIGATLCGFLISGPTGKATPFGNQAAEWVISEWINTPGFTLEDLSGKVVVIDFFQLWCPGCNSFSIPLMEVWKQRYGSRDDIQFVGIHTVFEGHAYQTPEKLRQYIKEKNITYPVGIDDYVSSQRMPETMIRYHTRGTPEITIIDKQGKIRFQQFGGFNPAVAEKLINTLLAEK